MDIIIDIDGTICEELPTDQKFFAKPLPGAKDAINDLYYSGHNIIFYSARSWGQYKITQHWLESNGFKYHQLILGKPIGDFWIDDRALQFSGNWNEILEKIEKK